VRMLKDMGKGGRMRGRKERRRVGLRIKNQRSRKCRRKMISRVLKINYTHSL